MATSMKCDTPGCHMRLKLNEANIIQLREQSAEVGQRAGVLCPNCVRQALEDDENFVLDFPLGEVVAEALAEKPRWRIVFSPRSAPVAAGPGAET